MRYATYEVLGRHEGHWRAMRIAQLGRDKKELSPKAIAAQIENERAGLKTLPKLSILTTDSRVRAIDAARLSIKCGATDVSLIEKSWELDATGKRIKQERAFVDFEEKAFA